MCRCCRVRLRGCTDGTEGGGVPRRRAQASRATPVPSANMLSALARTRCRRCRSTRPRCRGRRWMRWSTAAVVLLLSQTSRKHRGEEHVELQHCDVSPCTRIEPGVGHHLAHGVFEGRFRRDDLLDAAGQQSAISPAAAMRQRRPPASAVTRSRRPPSLRVKWWRCPASAVAASARSRRAPESVRKFAARTSRFQART